MKIIAANNRANYNFTISNKIEAGIVLSGSEVKSLRINTGSIRGSYIIEKNNKEQIQLDETNEKMDALKVEEIRSFRNNRKYSEEFSKFYERLKGI